MHVRTAYIERKSVMSPHQLKIKNTSRYIAVLLKIGLAVLIMIALLALAAIGILLFSSGHTRASFLAAFQVTANNGTVLEIAPRPLLIMFLFMLVDTLLIMAAVFFIHGIFRDLQNGCTPFTRQNTVRIQFVAAITIVLSIVGGCSDALVDYYTIGGLKWQINAIGLISGLIIYCISFIFRYGCDLQQASDETL